MSVALVNSEFVDYKVSRTGKVTGLKPGTVTITATATSGKSAKVKITVK